MPPLECKIKHKNIFKKSNNHCEWGLDYPKNIEKCFTCNKYIGNDYEVFSRN